jgi:predicted lipid-binding transport protein (Tim44 family)
MGDGYYLDILLFALVAAFLIFRLRSVLGRRDGFQGKSEDRMPFPGRPERGPEPPVRLPDRDGQSEAPGFEPAPTSLPASVDAGITQIRVADPSFDEKEFIGGAQKAFEWILQAFANDDLRSLQPLLSQDVFNNFAQSIRGRQQAGHKLETTLVGFGGAEIVEAYMAGRTAHVTIKFVTEQIGVTRDAAGQVVDGDPSSVNEIVDYWTFARDTRASDPNWTLVATGAPEGD